MQEAAEYLTSNRFIRYPFADDSVLSIPESSARAVFGCFVDAMIQLKDHRSGIVPKVIGISLLEHTLSFTLSGPSRIVLNCTRSKSRFPVITGETDWCWYTFVLSSDGIRELESVTDLDGLSSDELELSPHCIGMPSLGVSTLEVCGGLKEHDGRRLTLQEALEASPDAIVSGDIGIEEGFNTTLSSEGAYLTVTAGPGAGAGTAPCPCEQTEQDSTRRGIWSKDGHVRLFNDTCYDYLPSGQGRLSGSLTLQAKCKACCTCEMYETLVNGRLVPLKNAILSAKRNLDRTLEDYEDSVRKWNERIRTATEDDIVMTMTAVPMESAGTNLSGSGVSGRMSRCGFTVNVRNDSFVNVKVVIDGITANGKIFQQTLGYLSGDTPVVKSSAAGQSVTLQPGKSLLISYFVRSDSYQRTSSRAGFSSTVRISAYHGDRLITRKSKVVNV